MMEIIDIRSDDKQQLDALLQLNNDHAVQTSRLDDEALRRMVGTAFYAKMIEPAEAMLLCFDQSADYQSPNFRWFKERYAAFVYVDRIIVDPNVSGRGLGRRLYQSLFEVAGDAGHEFVACEVNSRPPNPISDAFHKALEFEIVGEAKVSQKKAVRYLLRRLD